ncbi:hypothetical protein Elgi_14300 [Paenibacillus elgii]|nr:hypothetical protein Elgi_14300 [Paenibacillus elgii]
MLYYHLIPKSSRGFAIFVVALLCVQPAVLAEGTIQVKVNQSLLGTEAQAQMTDGPVTAAVRTWLKRLE